MVMGISSNDYLDTMDGEEFWRNQYGSRETGAVDSCDMQPT